MATRPPEESPRPPAPSDPAVTEAVRRWAQGEPLSRDAAFLLGLFLPATMLGASMWRVRSFTVDDSFISFRYARNFAHGLGLVFNQGERIEGYTNFLFTLILGLGIKMGARPEILAKVLGSASAFGTLALVYRLAGKLLPFRTLPCVATWLLASTIVCSGYAVFGLETSMFVFLVVAGTCLLLEEEAFFGGAAVARRLPGTRLEVPYSGIVFALAGLTRPEAPAFIGILMLFLGKGIAGRRNLVRAALFVAPLAVHMLWRHAYYGAWLPNTLGAKTGNLRGQAHGGSRYVLDYLKQAGSMLWLGLLGVGAGVVNRRRDLLSITAVAGFVVAYVIAVGGDWMPLFRFMAPFEPFAFLLVDFGARTIADRREPSASLALVLFAVATAVVRADVLHDSWEAVAKEKRFWDNAAGGTASWFKTTHAKRGEIAIGDIGRVAYETDFPIVDLLGLVDPVVPKLPGGYTQKIGPDFLDYVFSRGPGYTLIISSNGDCEHPSVPGSRAIYHDPRFLERYGVAGKVTLDGGYAWCIYQRKDF